MIRTKSAEGARLAYKRASQERHAILNKDTEMSKAKIVSANGKGRTLWELMMGLNSKEMTPIEHQYHNPLKASVGVSMLFDHEPELAGTNFFVKRIDVYETIAGKKKFYHTDYALSGIKLGDPKPIKIRLRITPAIDEPTEYKYQLYKLYDEMGWDQDFYDGVLCNKTKEFHVNHNDNGEELGKPIVYWRVNDVFDPYYAKVTGIKDENNNGQVEEEELERSQIDYWDYSRTVTDPDTKQDSIQYLDIELDRNSKYFTFYRGRDIHPSQITVI